MQRDTYGLMPSGLSAVTNLLLVCGAASDMFVVVSVGCMWPAVWWKR